MLVQHTCRREQIRRGDNGYIKKKYGVAIGEQSAEAIKISAGSAMPLKSKLEVKFRGRDLASGLPKDLTINSNEIAEALNPSSHGYCRFGAECFQPDSARVGRGCDGERNNLVGRHGQSAPYRRLLRKDIQCADLYRRGSDSVRSQRFRDNHRPFRCLQTDAPQQEVRNARRKAPASRGRLCRLYELMNMFVNMADEAQTLPELYLLWRVRRRKIHFR